MTRDTSKSDDCHENPGSFQFNLFRLMMQTFISVLLKSVQVMTWQFSNINTALFVKKRFPQMRDSARIDARVSLKRGEKKLEGLNGCSTGLLQSLSAGS